MLGFALHAMTVVEHPVDDAGKALALIIGADLVPAAETDVTDNRMKAWTGVGVLIQRAEVAALIAIARAADGLIQVLANKNHHVEHTVQGCHVNHLGIVDTLDLREAGQGKALPGCILDLQVGLLVLCRL
ncbi:hypothetical protein D9M71_398220 [compost metagenome]